MKFYLMIGCFAVIGLIEIMAFRLPHIIEKQHEEIKSINDALNFEIQGISERIKRNREKLAKINREIATGTGKATYYHSKFPGRTMKYGEVYLKDSNSVACNFLPPETIILFENTKNNKMTIGVVRDTGNLFGRQFDLSEKLMNDLDGINDGVIEVQWLAVVK